MIWLLGVASAFLDGKVLSRSPGGILCTIAGPGSNKGFICLPGEASVVVGDSCPAALLPLLSTFALVVSVMVTVG